MPGQRVEGVEALEVGSGCRAAGRRCPRGLSTARARRSVEVPAPETAGASTAGRPGEALRNAHASSSLVRVRNAEGVDAHRAGVVDLVDRARLAGQDHARGAPASRSAAASVGAPLGVRRVGAGQADDRLPVVRRHHGRRRRRSGRRRRRRCRRRRTGCWRRWPGRCARRPGPSWRGRPCAAAGSSRSASKARRSGGPARRSRRAAPLGQLLGEVRELAEAGERALRGGDLGASRRLVDRSRGDRPRVRGRRRPRSGRTRPSRRGEVVGELLDGVGAAGRVGDPRDVRLLDQQRRGVAGDPAAEGVRAPERASNGSTVTASAPPDAGREGGDGGAEHVHPGSYLLIIGRLVTACWRWSAGRRRAAELEHPRPEPAGGAQLGDGRELLVGGGVAGTRRAPAASSTARPASVSARRYAAPDRQRRSRAPGRRRRPGRARAVASTTTPRVPAVAGQLGDGDQVLPRPPRAASTPRLVPGASSRPSAYARNASATATGSDGASRTTGARSSRTPSSRVARSVAGRRLEPQRGDPAVEVDERGLVGGPGVAAREVRPDVPGAGPRRAAPGLEVVEEGRRCRAG